MKRIKYAFGVSLVFCLLFCFSQICHCENEKCDKILDTNIVKYLIKCKNCELRKEYSAKEYSEYLPYILSNKVFIGAPNVVFKFNSDGTFIVDMFAKKEPYVGAWSLRGNMLILVREKKPEEIYEIATIEVNYGAKYNSYYCDLTFAEPIPWANDSWGLSVRYDGDPIQ